MLSITAKEAEANVRGKSAGIVSAGNDPALLPDRLGAARIARLTGEPAYTDGQVERQLEQLRFSNELNQLMLENMHREIAKKDKQENATWAMSTAGSLWMTRKVATEETILSFLRSNTNNSALATKVAPQVFSLFKSRPSGAMLLLAMGAGATYYLYEWFGFDESVKPVAVIRDGRVSALPRQ